MGVDGNIDWAAATASALDWWREAGVDTLVEDSPCDWLALPTPGAPSHAVPAAAAPAALPDTPEALAAWRLGPDAPEAGWPGRRLGAEGTADVPLLLVTDWPERADFAAGRLFAEGDGRLLERMLRAIALTRDEVAIVPVATARPPSARAAEGVLPRLGEVVRHQIALLRPARVLLMGEAASRAVLATDCRAARGSARTIKHEGGEARLVASFHPRLLLDRPTAKADAWRDLQLLMGDRGA